MRRPRAPPGSESSVRRLRRSSRRWATRPRCWLDVRIGFQALRRSLPEGLHREGLCMRRERHGGMHGCGCTDAEESREALRLSAQRRARQELLTWTEEDFVGNFKVNMLAYAQFVKLLTPDTIRAGGGAIVTTGNTSAHGG